jgi:hypothetical protein
MTSGDLRGSVAFFSWSKHSNVEGGRTNYSQNFENKKKAGTSPLGWRVFFSMDGIHGLTMEKVS